MKISLRAKTIILIVLIAAIIGASGLIVTRRFINRLINDTYKEKANDIARTTATVIDAGDAARLRDEVLAIFNATDEKVGSEDWGSDAFNIGGDEFVVVVSGTDYVNIDDRIKQFNEAADAEEGAPWEKVSAAIGYAAFKKGDAVEDVFRRANRNMYERKTAMKLHNI